MPTELRGLPTTLPQIGGSGFAATLVAVASVNTTPVGTIADTNETDLMTYALPANTLNANNIGVRITAWGTTLVGANNQQIKLYFGSGVVADPGAVAMGSNSWRHVCEVIRTSSGNQSFNSIFWFAGTNVSVYSATTSQTDTSAITIKVTGKNGVATLNGVQQLGMAIEIFNLTGGGSFPNPYLPASLNQSTASQVIMPMGTGSGTAVAPGVANVNTTAVGTIANVAETDLMTYSLPANSLSANGKGVRVTAWGTTLAGANNQTIKMYFGSAVMRANGPSAYGSTSWTFTAEVIRTSSGNQLYRALAYFDGTAVSVSASTTAQTDTSAIVIKMTGQNGAATVDGVKQIGMIVEFIN